MLAIIVWREKKCQEKIPRHIIMSAHTEYLRGQIEERSGVLVERPRATFTERGNDVWARRSGRTYLGGAYGGASSPISPVAGSGMGNLSRLVGGKKKAVSAPKVEEPLVKKQPKKKSLTSRSHTGYKSKGGAGIAEVRAEQEFNPPPPQRTQQQQKEYYDSLTNEQQRRAEHSMSNYEKAAFRGKNPETALMNYYDRNNPEGKNARGRQAHAEWLKNELENPSDWQGKLLKGLVTGVDYAAGLAGQLGGVEGKVGEAVYKNTLGQFLPGSKYYADIGGPNQRSAKEYFSNLFGDVTSIGTEAFNEWKKTDEGKAYLEELFRVKKKPGASDTKPGASDKKPPQFAGPDLGGTPLLQDRERASEAMVNNNPYREQPLLLTDIPRPLMITDAPRPPPPPPPTGTKRKGSRDRASELEDVLAGGPPARPKKRTKTPGGETTLTPGINTPAKRGSRAEELAAKFAAARGKGGAMPLLGAQMAFADFTKQHLRGDIHPRRGRGGASGELLNTINLLQNGESQYEGMGRTPTFKYSAEVMAMAPGIMRQRAMARERASAQRPGSKAHVGTLRGSEVVRHRVPGNAPEKFVYGRATKLEKAALHMEHEAKEMGMSLDAHLKHNKIPAAKRRTIIKRVANARRKMGE